MIAPAPSPYAVAPHQTLTLAVPAAAGAVEADPPGPPATIDLVADVYYPVGAGPFPVLLMRQPYGRAIASTVVYAHPRWYASHGYIVVIQDVRGRGSSGGEFDLFRHEAADGLATVQWAAQLPQSSGAVGMYGFSYQGMTQLYAAAQQPPALKALAPAMVGYDLYADWAYENG
ncbi:MAG TPA: CocE/NonD family hydrolase, partial [Nodosilinea sp.]|nr:CocE/NonD family hydrolase [Nodosilinea sp.]